MDVPKELRQMHSEVGKYVIQSMFKSMEKVTDNLNDEERREMRALCVETTVASIASSIVATLAQSNDPAELDPLIVQLLRGLADTIESGGTGAFVHDTGEAL